MNKIDCENIETIIQNGLIKLNEPMSLHTSFGIGGNTCFILPEDKQELPEPTTVAQTPSEPPRPDAIYLAQNMN